MFILISVVTLVGKIKLFHWHNAYLIFKAVNNNDKLFGINSNTDITNKIRLKKKDFHLQRVEMSTWKWTTIGNTILYSWLYQGKFFCQISCSLS